jgi:hypothetical protein
MGFVKRTFKDSHASLVEKLVEKAHLLESNFANERLRALRNVEPGERMAIGDIFIAPPPDYRPWGYLSPYPQSPSDPAQSPRQQISLEPALSPRYSAPTPSPLYQNQNQLSPYYSPPAHSSHSRSRSDPMPSPGFSSASTLVSESDRPATPPKDTAPLKFAMIPQPSSSAPEPNMYLLPATTYQADIAKRGHIRLDSNVSSVLPPRISYSPEERPISFTIPFDTRSSSSSRFDTSSNSESSSEPSNLLDEIDDAIDQVFLYSVQSHRSYDDDDAQDAGKEVVLSTKTYEQPAKAYELPAKAYELPAKTYELPAKTYEPSPKTTELSPRTLELPSTAYELPATTYDPSPKPSEPSPKTTARSPTTYELPATTYALPSTTYEPPVSAPKPSATPKPTTTSKLSGPAPRSSAPTPKYTLTPKTYTPPTSTKPTIRSAKKYEPEAAKQTMLPSTTYAPVAERVRKDSAWQDKELPPVPVDGR